jgi:hypothetical protein
MIDAKALAHLGPQGRSHVGRGISPTTASEISGADGI